jgi:uncharacterized protein involved in outer membrane biogenesis
VNRLPDRWKVTNLSGKVGRSDVAGQVEILTNTPRRKFVADIVSDAARLPRSRRLRGMPAGASPAKRSPEQKAEATKLARQGRVFSDDRFELDRLRDYDAHFRFRGKAVRVDDVPMEIVEMNIDLDRGVLRYDPVKVGIADGTLTLVGTIDANGKAPRLDMRLEGRNLDLARIYPELASPRGRAGRVGGFVKVKAQGSSVAGMTRTADGDGAFIMSGGEASALALLLTNLDLAGAVPLIVGGDRTAALYCAVSAFGIDDGLVRPRLMVIDTSRERIDGEGTIDLAHEKYALVLKAKSKQFSIFALRGPIVIGGSLRNPTVGPSVARSPPASESPRALRPCRRRSRSCRSSTSAARPTSIAGACSARPTTRRCRSRKKRASSVTRSPTLRRDRRRPGEASSPGIRGPSSPAARRCVSTPAPW